MASYNDQNDDLNTKFEKWVSDKLKLESNDQDLDVSIFTNFILSALTEEENSDEEKSETIKPILQELNQNNTFNEEKLLDEIIDYWNKLKLESNDNDDLKKPKSQNMTENPTDTILNMINKHKNQLVEPKKKNIQDENDEEQVGYCYNELESDSENEESSKKNDNLFSNTNLQDAMSRDKQNRDKMAETYHKQREQAKKALIDQKQKEIDKKKKAQQKAAKVERKR